MSRRIVLAACAIAALAPSAASAADWPTYHGDVFRALAVTG